MLLFILLLGGCIPSQEKVNLETNFDWLLGSWQRTNDDPESNTFEYWNKKTDNEYIGLGCTLQKGDTVFKESIRIVKLNEQWIYEVNGVNEGTTNFPLINDSIGYFIAENKKNEFPKQIKYHLKGENKLVATISNEEHAIDFIFKRFTD